VEEAAQIVIGGLLQGSVFAIVALGFALVFRVTGVINLAQGAFCIVGALSTITVSTFYLTAQMVGAGVLIMTDMGLPFRPAPHLMSVATLEAHFSLPGAHHTPAGRCSAAMESMPAARLCSPRIKSELVEEVNAELTKKLVGVDWNFSQNIRDNVLESLSGVKGELVVKVFGPDLQVLQEKAGEVEGVLARVRGVADLGVEQQFGQPQVRFATDRAALARYGLNVADVNDAIETAIGGKAVTQFLEGDRVFDGAVSELVLSLLREERISAAELDQLQSLIAQARRKASGRE